MTAMESAAQGRRLQRLELINNDIPARRTFEAHCISMEAGRTVFDMDIPAWLRDADGAMPPGGLGVLVDTALGSAVASEMEEDVFSITSHLHIEFIAPIAEHVRRLQCTGVLRALDDRFGFATGEVTTDDGKLVAVASVGAVSVRRRPLFGRGRTHQETPRSYDVSGGPTRHQLPHPLIDGSPAHQELGTVVLSADSTGVRTSTLAVERLGNFSGGLHGGVGVFLGESVLGLAIRSASADHPPMRPAELRVAFLRPIPADGTEVTGHATVIHLGRRLAAARGELTDGAGHPCILADATFIPV